jgi:hypothetical protein
MTAKLVKNNKTIKFPSVKNGVEKAFQRSLAKAREQKWTKVIIIGQSAHGHSMAHSVMTDYTAIGMLELAKVRITEELC